MVRENLTQLLSQLSVQSAQGESAKVETTCLQLLENGCSEPGSILKNLLVAAIQQDKYQKGLNLLKNYKHLDDKFGSELVLEKLYIFYKLNKSAEFEKLYATVTPLNSNTFFEKTEREMRPLRGILHVRAQFCYKNGFYEEAFQIYHYLSTHNSDAFDDEVELACNVRAPLTGAPHLKLKNDLVVNSETTSYDLLFNESMIKCARGKHNEAIELLNKAHDIVKQEGYETDLDTIELQLAYVFQLKNDKLDCKKHLNNLLSRLAPDSPIYLLAKNNLKAFTDFSKYTTNLNLVMRELNLEKVNSINLQHFTREQWSIINRNQLFLHFFNNSSVQSKPTTLSRILSDYNNLIDDVNLETYRTQAKKAYHHALSMINSGVEGCTMGFSLLAVQLLVIEKQWDNAIRLCETFLNKLWERSQNVRTGKHHVVCYILFQLYNITARAHSKELLLKKLASESKILPRDAPFWKHIAFQYLECGDLKNSKKLFRQILTHDDDKFIRHILADDSINIEKGDELTSGIDIESLILSSADALDSHGARKRQNVNKIQKKRQDVRRKRRAQKAKKFLETRVTSKPLDPERWIPLKDRTTYRPKKKQQAKQTQGGSASKKAEQSLDISKKVKKSAASKSKKKSRK
ncbi:related to Signal recognition particle subunit SRP72 [Zygosaccharomyces bailii]|nr:related to Signal recognition particle subunit SRP72 [Zygosaccharomyces bailii]